MMKVACLSLFAAFPAWAEEAFVSPLGCEPEVRVEWQSCVSAVIYRCDGTEGVAWVQSRTVGPFASVVLTYDQGGNLIRQLGTGGFEDGPVAQITDPFDFDLLQETRHETIGFSMGVETTTAELVLDRGFRFHTASMLMRADMIGRSSAPEREDVVFDESAYFLPGIPVMMVHYEDPTDVVWANDAPDLAQWQECS